MEKNAFAQSVGDHPLLSTAILTVCGYGLVIGTLYGDAFDWLYPALDLSAVNVFSHLIALNNAVAVLLLLLGWWWIRQGRVGKHQKAMTGAFCLILIFLVLYLVKTGGGGRKEFVGPPGAWTAYVSMLGIHIVLSILSVPLVLYTLLLGITNPVSQIGTTHHPVVGRVAATCWIISLVLGIVAYLLLNHVYAFQFVPS